jgi:glycosyltransferase involved in cell wall biosynthesis
MQGIEIMHVLIIPGEELNENNQLSSVFEIHQAHALKDLNVRVGFISTNLNGSIYKELMQGIKTLFYGFNKRIQTRVQLINEINLVEAYGKYVTPSFLNLYRKERINAGVLAYKHYCYQFGSPDVIHAHSRFLDSILIAKKIKENFGTHYVITEHSTLHRRNIVSKKEYIDYVAAVDKAKSWIVVSESLGNIIVSNIDKLKLKFSKTFRTVPNVVDSNFSFVEVGKNEKFVFLNIASLEDKKNHVLLLESFKHVTEKFPNVELRICGRGALEKKLKNHARVLGIQQVEFLGSLDRCEVQKEFINSNAFVLSSDVETFGVVVIEALAIGRPVVSTICGGPEYIVNSDNGILVESNNIQGLANAMCEMIKNYSQYNLNAISKNCIENYGTKVIGKRLIQIYQEALI